MANRKRNIQMKFYVTEEKRLMTERWRSSHTAVRRISAEDGDRRVYHPA